MRGGGTKAPPVPQRLVVARRRENEYRAVWRLYNWPSATVTAPGKMKRKDLQDHVVAAFEANRRTYHETWGRREKETWTRGHQQVLDRVKLKPLQLKQLGPVFRHGLCVWTFMEDDVDMVGVRGTHGGCVYSAEDVGKEVKGCPNGKITIKEVEPLRGAKKKKKKKNEKPKERLKVVPNVHHTCTAYCRERYGGV